MDVYDTLIENFQKGLDFIIDLDRQRLVDQGHVATGRLKNGLKTKVYLNGEKLTADFMMESYGIDLDQGVPASRIRYSLTDLESWAKIVRPDLSSKQRKRFVYNTWRKHKREGMPTRASLAFSKTGERLNWIKRGDEIVEERFDELFGISEWLLALFNASVTIIQNVA